VLNQPILLVLSVAFLSVGLGPIQQPVEADEFSGLANPLYQVDDASQPRAGLSQQNPFRYGTVPKSPTAPQVVSRPTNWPGATPTQQAAPINKATLASVVRPTTKQQSQPKPSFPAPSTAISFAHEAPKNIKPCEGAQILARVGSEVVLKSDILSFLASQMLNKKVQPIPEEQREILFRQLLPAVIENKLFYVDAKRNIPPEGLEQVDDQLDKAFLSEELPRMMKAAKVEDRQQLETKLRKLDSSIENQKQFFKERALAGQWVRMNVKQDEPVTHDQMLNYYYDHLDEYKFKPRVRWEQLSIKFKKCGSKAEAYNLIAQMGNKVQNRTPWATVAKEGSHGTTAQKGGVRDWTEQGSLRSTKIDQALFQLQTGALSPIIEDETGFHIIRVIENKAAHRTSFAEAQKEIAKTIKKERSSKQMDEYYARLTRETLIWTVFDGMKSPKSYQTIATRQKKHSKR
jgi:PPIC-type PPIASE domain